MELIFCCVKERDDLMVKIIKEDLDIEEALKKKLKINKPKEKELNKHILMAHLL